MKNRVLSGAIITILGLLIAIVPQFIFPTCAAMVETAAGGTVPMKCFWAARAEIGVGLLILCGGIAMIFIKSLDVRIGISIMTALTGVLGALVPTLLIGVCGMNTMRCRMTTFPALMILSALTITVCVINGVYLWKRSTRVNGAAYEQETANNS